MRDDDAECECGRERRGKGCARRGSRLSRSRADVQSHTRTDQQRQSKLRHRKAQSPTSVPTTHKRTHRSVYYTHTIHNQMLKLTEQGATRAWLVQVLVEARADIEKCAPLADWSIARYCAIARLQLHDWSIGPRSASRALSDTVARRRASAFANHVFVLY